MSILQHPMFGRFSMEAAGQAMRIVAQYTAYEIVGVPERRRSAPPRLRRHGNALHPASVRLNGCMEKTMKVQVYTHPG